MNDSSAVLGVDADSDADETFRRSVTDRGYTALIAQAVLIGATFLTGTGYVLLQWLRVSVVLDAWFVSMLIGATAILAIGLAHIDKYIRNKGLGFFLFCCAKEHPSEAFAEHEAMCRAVMNPRRMTLTGILYGLTIGAAPMVLDVWNDDVILRSALAGFMFVVNFVTGIAFCGLITFFIRSLSMGRIIKVNLWQVNNPGTAFVLGATRRIAILASLYICICISSILFSVLPITGWVIAYSFFAAFIILATLAIPPSPIVAKLKQAKEAAVLAIDKQLHLSFYKTLDEATPKESQVDFEKVKTLLELREKIDAIDIWPFRVKSFITAASVILFSSIPVFLQLILESID